MIRWLRLLQISLTIGGSMGFAAVAEASVTCVQVHLANQDPKSLGFAPSDVEALVAKVAQAIGLTPSGITVVPCSGIGKVATQYYDRKDIPRGEYIFYDPVWVREVVGTTLANSANRQEYDEAVVLFGHELGHLIDRDFTANVGLPRIEKETNADRFAGCAAAGLAVKWDRVSDFLNRVRGDVDTDYPSRQRSIAAAKVGFDACWRSSILPSDDVAGKIEGTNKSFCSDLLAVASHADRDFEGLRGAGSSNGDAWDANADLDGFLGCRITKDDNFNFTCQTDTVDSKKLGFSLLKKMSSRIRSCLNQSWVYSEMDEKTGFFNNHGSSKTIIISLYDAMTFDDSQKYTGNLVIYDPSRKVVNEKEVAKAGFTDPLKPSDYCSNLQLYVESAKTGFKNIIRTKKPKGTFFGVKKQLNHWNGCDIGSLGEGGTDKYLTCELGPFNTREGVEKMMAEVQPDISKCVGENWDVVRKTRTDGTLRYIFSSSDEFPEIELRYREGSDGEWELKMDVDSLTVD